MLHDVPADYVSASHSTRVKDVQRICWNADCTQMCFLPCETWLLQLIVRVYHLHENLPK